MAEALEIWGAKMDIRNLVGATALAAALAIAGQASAVAINDPAPAGPVLLDLNGTPIVHSYSQYTAAFVATSTATDLSFAFRDDPGFLFLDDIVLTTGGGPNLVTNGGFESGPIGSNAPTGWTYVNVYGSAFAGYVANNNPHSGLNNYNDGSVQAYDAITQNITTVVGQTYNLSFWLSENSSYSTYSSLSTNGDITGPTGNGIDLIVYAGQGIPTPGGVPEPATWAMMLAGFFGAGAVLRNRRRTVAVA